MMTVKEIYDIIDGYAPFSTQESWDNSGLLAGCHSAQVTKALTALDITADVIREAAQLGAELIISHHPIIFHPLRMLDTSPDAENPTAMLIRHGINAICTHTPFDMAPMGMNKGLYELLCQPLGLSTASRPLEDCGEGRSIGRIYELGQPLTAREAAKCLKTALGCTCVRYTCGDNIIKSCAINSGSGNSFVTLARELGADCLISGDLKHDALISARNMGFSVFDCGHYHTERIFMGLMKEWLSSADIGVTCSESCTDPAEYCIVM